MPRGDKTGPNGQGVMTGRKMGFCTGNSSAGIDQSPRLGIRSRMRGQGLGRGRGNWNIESSESLSQENNRLQAEINALKQRLNALEK
ncbi:MAG: DUF5320 domain-containing protein [Bacteroidales bacterium]|jgi:hypothetical protein|nr:DUF5320 domain-containing protein [Bacteroidales bacterium]